jgi:bifunctional N-acetylglucosamine-1-phosphate-uridyltransferase/glucosamine-1-phosphate-acetyltransferase GlmU-like protein
LGLGFPAIRVAFPGVVSLRLTEHEGVKKGLAFAFAAANRRCCGMGVCVTLQRAIVIRSRGRCEQDMRVSLHLMLHACTVIQQQAALQETGRLSDYNIKVHVRKR